MRVALATCAALPQLDQDTQHLIAPLHSRGIEAAAAVWDDATVDWTAFDLVVVRSCWDYLHRRDQFLSWAARVPHIANPAATLAWNTHKGYLLDLEADGVPTVRTTWLPPKRQWDVPACGEWVIKPAVSLASLDTGRYDLDDPRQRRLAEAHIARLHMQGRLVMVQPYMSTIEAHGESSLVFLGDCFSHAVRKAAILRGPDEGVDRRFLPAGHSDLLAHTPTPAELALAKRVLSSVPGAAQNLLYARVDLVPSQDGTPLLLELELTEPQLYLGSAGAAERFAAVIADRAMARRAIRISA